MTLTAQCVQRVACGRHSCESVTLAVVRITTSRDVTQVVHIVTVWHYS